jgi:hypothetical protein
MSKAAINRYAAIVLLGIAIFSAVALKLNLSRLADGEIDTQGEQRVVYLMEDRSPNSH